MTQEQNEHLERSTSIAITLLKLNNFSLKDIPQFANRMAYELEDLALVNRQLENPNG